MAALFSQSLKPEVRRVFKFLGNRPHTCFDVNTHEHAITRNDSWTMHELAMADISHPRVVTDAKEQSTACFERSTSKTNGNQLSTVAGSGMRTTAITPIKF